MKQSSSSKIYASLDEREIAEDRRIINEKLRRHLSSRHQNIADDDMNIDCADNDYDDDFYDDADINNNHHQLDRYMSEGDDDLVDSMQRALGTSTRSGFGGGDSVRSLDDIQWSLGTTGMEQRSQRSALLPDSNNNVMNRGGTVASASASMSMRSMGDSLSCIGTLIEIPKTQSMTKQIYGVLYICLSVGILVSYFFFLESCKLVNYGH